MSPCFLGTISNILYFFLISWNIACQLINIVISCSPVRFFSLYRINRAFLLVDIISSLERSCKTSLLKTSVISFLGQAIYVQFVDVDFEGCRAAGQPRNSQGHFLCSTPYRARPSLTELLRQARCSSRINIWQTTHYAGGLYSGCSSEEGFDCVNQLFFSTPIM